MRTPTISDEDFLEAAKKAQYKVIQKYILSHYFRNAAKIEQWDDFRFFISKFNVNCVKVDLTKNRIRERLDDFAKKGFIERIKQGNKRTSPVDYRFPREVCDELAQIAIEYWQERGYSQTEIRPMK